MSKKLNIKKILEQVGGTEEEFANEMGITIDELQKYINGTPLKSLDLFGNIISYTGLQPDQLFIEDGQTSSSSGIEKLNNTWQPSNMAKNSLGEYIRQGLHDISESTVQEEIHKVERYLQELRKPKISFAGQSDAGKSTLINALLKAETMPAKWTPTTSVIVYIKHINDRPSFFGNDTVWIFGKNQNEYWNDANLANQAYCERFAIAKGDFSLLEEYGTHQGIHKKQAFSAVAFLDSPLLQDCDILDLPGIAASKDDDSLHKLGVQDPDILIYLSRSNGFLQDSDRDYLSYCIKRLNPIERENNGIEKLGNLFIIASQSGAVNGGNQSELNEIFDRQCHALCRTLVSSSSQTLLPQRTAQTKLNYTEDDLRKRFFTYEKDIPRLCKNFLKTFSKLAEDFPKADFQFFIENIRKIAAESKTAIKNRIEEYNEMLSDSTKYYQLACELRDKEPAREAMQHQKNKEMLEFISSLETSSKQKITSMYNSELEEDHLIELIDANGYKNKKSDQREFSTLVGNRLFEKIQQIIKEDSDSYERKLKEYLKDYSHTIETDQTSDINVKFDVNNSFALGLVGVGALGASAAWLATSTTAWTVSILGPLAGWGPMLAVGGFVGIAIAGLIGAAASFIKLSRWKKDLAQAIIKAYDSNDYLGQVKNDVHKYWNDTSESFIIASEKIESDWKAKLSEYESLGNVNTIQSLKEKLANAQRGLDFFIKLPL